MVHPIRAPLDRSDRWCHHRQFRLSRPAREETEEHQVFHQSDQDQAATPTRQVFHQSDRVPAEGRQAFLWNLVPADAPTRLAFLRSDPDLVET